MTAKRNQIVIVPVVLTIAGALFAAGHSMRTAAIRDQGIADSANESSLIVEPRIGNAAGAPEGTMLAAQQDTTADQMHTHTGIIVSMNGDRLILRDDDNDTWYHLDDQKAASSYLGKKVRITGEIDPATDVIHVESIEESKV